MMTSIDKLKRALNKGKAKVAGFLGDSDSEKCASFNYPLIEWDDTYLIIKGSAIETIADIKAGIKIGMLDVDKLEISDFTFRNSPNFSLANKACSCGNMMFANTDGCCFLCR